MTYLQKTDTDLKKYLEARKPYDQKKESIDFFIENFEKAEAETRGKKPNVVLITADEVRRAAEFKKNERRSEKAGSDPDKAR